MMILTSQMTKSKIKLSYNEKSNTYYVTKKIGTRTLSFCFAKYNDNNKLFWEIYSNEQNNNTRRNGVCDGKRIINVSDVTISFINAMDLVDKISSDAWIAFIYENYSMDSELTKDNVHMCAIVFVDTKINNPTGMFTGIFRNYTKFGEDRIRNLSPLLNMFAMYAINEIYNKESIQIKYMITNPVIVMINILLKYYNENRLIDSIWVGDNRQRMNIIEMQTNLEQDKKLSSQPLEEYKSFDANLKLEMRNKVNISKSFMKFVESKIPIDTSDESLTIILDYYQNLNNDADRQTYITNITNYMKSKNDIDNINECVQNYIRSVDKMLRSNGHKFSNGLYDDIPPEKLTEEYIIDENFRSAASYVNYVTKQMIFHPSNINDKTPVSLFKSENRMIVDGENIEMPPWKSHADYGNHQGCPIWKHKYF